MDVTELVRRAAAIRMPRTEIARMAGLHEDTVGRILNGDVGGHARSVARIEAAIAAEERRLLADLAGRVTGDAA
jgi:hypothetical protein